MDVHLTRHARNRMRLYGITREEIEASIQDGEKIVTPQTYRSDLFINGRTIRVAWVEEDGTAVVKTVFVKYQP